jgi:uncharacterized protein YqhQ
LPGGLGGAILVGMDRAGVFALLRRADETADLPRLGGMARADGVVIASERFWAFARRDGSIQEGTMPSPPTFARRVPLLRGLLRLGLAMAPLFRGTNVARPRERLFLAAAVIAPFSFVFLPHSAALPLAIALAVMLLAWMLRGRTLFLHGAEHRAIAAAEAGSLVAAWKGLARPTRFSRRCGTNFAALVLPVSVGADHVWPLPVAAYTPFAVTLISLALTMELWQVVQTSRHRVAQVFLLPGLALQRLTTREPSVEETQVALSAVASVLRRELP